MTIDNSLDFTEQHVRRPWTVDDFKIAAGLPERRRDKRINVALPVLLDKAMGVTRDVSASGVFFWVKGVYAIGDVISFSIGRKTACGNFKLKCRGDVIRTIPRGSEVGLAVRIAQPMVEPMST